MSKPSYEEEMELDREELKNIFSEWERIWMRGAYGIPSSMVCYPLVIEILDELFSIIRSDDEIPSPHPGAEFVGCLFGMKIFQVNNARKFNRSLGKHKITEKEVLILYAAPIATL